MRVEEGLPSLDWKRLSAENQDKSTGSRRRPGCQDSPQGRMAHGGQSSGVHLEPPYPSFPTWVLSRSPPTPALTWGFSSSLSHSLKSRWRRL